MTNLAENKNSTSDITDLCLTETREALLNKEFSAKELTEAYIAKCNKHKNLNAFITDSHDLALKQADESDKKIASGDAGKLEGIPFGIKDLFCTKGVLTTAASHILDGFIPPYESTVTTNLLSEGAVTLGKLNLDEFAMGSSNTTSSYGNVINPWKRKSDDADLVPGGSSGGSSTAVSAHLCVAATGTDTGGSIRQPATYTGVVGVKPTYGRCSRWGIVAFASSLDQAGIFTHNVRDSSAILEIMAGFDKKDSTSVDVAVPEWEKTLSPDMKGKKIGIPAEYQADGMPEEIKALWEQGAAWLKDAGAEIIDINLPHTKYALPTYYIIAPAEASANLARYDGVRYGHRTKESISSLDDMYEKTRAEGFGKEVKRRIMIGTYVLSHGYYDAYYIKAQRVRSLIAQDFTNAFEKVDAILTPTTPTPAFAIGENEDDPIAMYLNDLFTVPASLAGIPGMSIPAGLSSDGLPLGLQVLSKAFDEQTMFDVAMALEQAAGFNARPEGF